MQSFPAAPLPLDTARALAAAYSEGPFVSMDWLQGFFSPAPNARCSSSPACSPTGTPA